MRNILVLFIIFWHSLLHAAVATNFSRLLNHIHTMHADIVQTMQNERGNVLQISYGQIDLVRPNQLRWEITKPIPQLIILNRSRIVIYDSDLAQVTIRTLHAAERSGTLLLSEPGKSIENNYVIKNLPSDAMHRQWFALIPRIHDSTFSLIEIAFLNNTLQVMRFKDHLGHISVITFKQVKTNTPLSPNLFVFKIPKNIDVINGAAM